MRSQLTRPHLHGPVEGRQRVRDLEPGAPGGAVAAAAQRVVRRLRDRRRLQRRAHLLPRGRRWQPPAAPPAKQRRQVDMHLWSSEIKPNRMKQFISMCHILHAQAVHGMT